MKSDKTMINGLVRVLASTLVLRCKARFFAWSVGENADSRARTFFYSDYDILDALCDDFARRINQVGGAVPGAYSKLAAISSIEENERLPVPEMITQLAKDHEQMVFDCQFVVSILEHHDDRESMDMLLQAISEHAACASKLRAFRI